MIFPCILTWRLARVQAISAKITEDRVKLDLMACWKDAMGLVQAHREALVAIAGIFLFLPTLLMAQFVGDPDLANAETTEQILAAYRGFFEENFGAILLSNLVLSFGSFTIFVLFAGRAGATVGDYFAAAGKLFLFYLIANLLGSLATVAGLFAFVIPGLYIAARLVLVPMAVAGDAITNPIEALRRSWQLTRGNGLMILLFIFVIIIVGVIIVGVVGLIVGILVALAAGGDGWPFLVNLIDALLGTLLSVVIIAVVAALYRRLSASPA